MGSITYDSTNDVIIVSGYKDKTTSPPTPWTIDDIHNADQSNGWGKTVLVVNPDNNAKFLIVKCHLRIEGGGEFDGTNPNFVMNQLDALWVEKTFIEDSDAGIRIGEQGNPYGLGSYGIKGTYLGAGKYYDVSWADAPADWKCILIQGKADIYSALIHPMNGRFAVKGTAEVNVWDSVILNTCRFENPNLVLMRVRLQDPNAQDFVEFSSTPRTMSGIEIFNTKYLLSFYNIPSGQKVYVVNPRFTDCRNAWSLPACAGSEIHVINPSPLPDPASIVALRGWNMEGATLFIDFDVEIKAVDQDGNPVANALVTLIDRKNNIYKAYTDSNGVCTVRVTSFKAIVSSSQKSDADKVIQPTLEDSSGTWYWNLYIYTPFTVIVYRSDYEHYTVIADVRSKYYILASMKIMGIQFGSLAFANRYETGEKIYLAIPLYMTDGTPVTDGTVEAKIMKPDGTVVQDWTQGTHIGDGIYVISINPLPVGFYIVEYKGQYKGYVCYGADTIMVTNDKQYIVGYIKRHPA